MEPTFKSSKKLENELKKSLNRFIGQRLTESNKFVIQNTLTNILENYANRNGYNNLPEVQVSSVGNNSINVSIIPREDEMKIRMGFVSNSSSSSFCIYGACLGEDEIRDGLRLNEDADIYDIMEKKLPKWWVIINGPDDSDLYMGRKWSSIKDNETGQEFKETIQFGLNELFGKKIQCSTHEEAWMNN